MKRALLSLALLGALAVPSLAQVNVVPQVGVTSAYVAKNSYSAGFFGLAPAASATDIVCIAGSATRTIRIERIVLSGSAGTLVTVPVVLYRHTAANTGGTGASTTANPANTVTKLDTSTPDATATLISYTANPTIGGVGTPMAASSITLPVTSAGVVSVPLVFDFLADLVNFRHPFVLRGTAQQACINLTGVSVSSGVLNGYIAWSEE